MCRAACFSRIAVTAACAVVTTWQAWHFVHCRGCVKWWHGVTCVAGVGHRERIILRGRRSSSDPVHFTHSTPHSALSTPHSTLRTLHFTLYTPHSMLYTPHSTLHTLHFTLHTLHCTLHTLHSTLYTSNLTLQTLHCTLHTLHSTLYTLHSTLYTLQSTLYTSHFPPYTFHFTLYTLHSTLYTPHSTLYTPHFTLYTPHATLYPVHFTLCTPHSTLHTFLPTPLTSHFTLRTPQSPLHTLHTTFPTQHFTFFTPHTFHSTVFCLPESTVHWYGNRGKMHKTVQIICFTEVFYCIRVRGLHLVCLFRWSLGDKGTNWSKYPEGALRWSGSRRSQRQHPSYSQPAMAAGFQNGKGYNQWIDGLFHGQPYWKNGRFGGTHFLGNLPNDATVQTTQTTSSRAKLIIWPMISRISRSF